MPPMILTWLSGRLSGAIIFCIACTAPLFAIWAAHETLALHGIYIPAPAGFPLYGPWEFVHGAIADKKAAEQARDAALAAKKTADADRDAWHANADKLGAALDRSNASIRALQAQSAADTAAAEKRLALERAKRGALQSRLDALDRAKIDTSSPAAAALSVEGLFQEGAP